MPGSSSLVVSLTPLLPEAIITNSGPIYVLSPVSSFSNHSSSLVKATSPSSVQTVLVNVNSFFLFFIETIGNTPKPLSFFSVTSIG